MLPIKPSEEEYLNKGVARLLIALLDMKDDAKHLFSGRNLMNLSFSSMSLLKDLNGILAYWLTEEHSMNRHIKVKISYQIIGSSQAKLMESQFNSNSPKRSTGDAELDHSQKPKRIMKYKKTNITHMLDMDSMSQGKNPKKYITAVKLDETPSQSNLPELKISKFSGSHRVEGGYGPIDNTPPKRGKDDSSLSPPPAKQLQESILAEDIYPIFKKKFSVLSRSDQDKVINILKGFMMDSPNHRISKIDNPQVSLKFSLIN